MNNVTKEKKRGNFERATQMSRQAGCEDFHVRLDKCGFVTILSPVGNDPKANCSIRELTVWCPITMWQSERTYHISTLPAIQIKCGRINKGFFLVMRGR